MVSLLFRGNYSIKNALAFIVELAVTQVLWDWLVKKGILRRLRAKGWTSTHQKAVKATSWILTMGAVFFLAPAIQTELGLNENQQLQAELAGKDTSLSAAAEKDAVLQSEVASLQKTLGDLKTQRDGLQDQLGRQGLLLSASQSNAAALQENMTSLKSQLEGLQLQLNQRDALLASRAAGVGQVAANPALPSSSVSCPFGSYGGCIVQPQVVKIGGYGVADSFATGLGVVSP